MPATNFEQRLRGRLSTLGAQGLTRSLHAPEGIDLSSNDYLGLATHPLLRQRMAEAVAREGCGSTGSRLLRGEREAFSALEQRFAAFKSSEKSLYFSSGYLANLAVLATLPEAGDVIFSDERNHASLIDGARLSRARRVIFPHRDTAALARMLQQESGAGQKFIVTESLFSMDGDFAPLPELAELCRAHEAILIVDEAHAVGIYGRRGSGLLEAAGIGTAVSINTAGKALGVAGAFVAGPGWVVDYLIQRARTFIFSTAAPPPVAAALDAALTVVEGEPWRRQQLFARAAYLRSRILAAGLTVAPEVSQIIPIVLGANERAVAAASTLRSEGFDVRAIRPPSVPAGSARLRLSINVNLSESTLNRFAAALTRAVGESLACSAASS